MLNASLKKLIALVSALLLMTMMAAPAFAVAPAPGPFERTWARTDKPVADDIVERTWIWGPEANTEVLQEPYVDSPSGVRDVQYFDKSRMEINHPDAPDDGLWYVTNGLLVVELMTGMMQVGDSEFEERAPAPVNIAGDSGHAETPTYATYGGLMDSAAYAEGSVITSTVDVDGNVGDDESLAQFNVTAGELAPATGHRTASIFWEFMTSSGAVYEDGVFVNDQLFLNPYYATGLPITEAYWLHIMVNGSSHWVLTQAFERRVLTYTPTNAAGFQVEAGNVGMHYYEWRYEIGPPKSPLVDQVLVAELTGASEVPPVETQASGDATVFVDEAGTLGFEVNVADIENVTASHIHLGAEGENGPVVAFLFQGEFSGTGTLATGTLTDEDLIGPLEGLTLEHLMYQMEQGNTYVNVHTTQNPGGEIRGQLSLADDGGPPTAQAFSVMFGALNESGVPAPERSRSPAIS